MTVAELKRGKIVERKEAGKEVAKLKPVYREGRPRIAKSRIDVALVLIVSRHSYKQVANLTNICIETLYIAAKIRKLNKDYTYDKPYK